METVNTAGSAGIAGDNRTADTGRCEEAFTVQADDPTVCGLFSDRYLEPTDEQIAQRVGVLLATHAAKLWCIMPTCESGPKPAETTVRVCKHYAQRLLPGHTIVTYGGAGDDVIDAIRRTVGVVAVSQDAVFDAIDWDRLLPIIGRTRRPIGRAGKGLNILSAHLALAALDLPSDAIVMQSDSEIAQYGRYNPFERLLVAWDQARAGGSRVSHVKTAKRGRNNEGIMGARATLQQLFCNPPPFVPMQVQQWAKLMYEALSPDPWMTTGEWLSSGAVIMNRPLATGYLEETLQSIWTILADQCGWRQVRFCGNPHNRLDGANTAAKEALMMTQIAQFIMLLAMHRQDPSIWTIDDIARVNRELMPTIGSIPVIGCPTDDGPCGPVTPRSIQSDRIIPPVSMLISEGLVDLNHVKQVVAESSE